MEIPEAFDIFFTDVYQHRWPALKAALLAPEKQIARQNLFAPLQDTGQVLQLGQDIPRSANGLLTHYVMDPASQAPPLLLNIQEGDVVLDMCAAPGGKTLLLAEGIASGGELIANELSEARRNRLTKVIQNYVPCDLRQRLFVKGKDGGKFALTHPQYFDKILVDAPCSGERHLLGNQKELQLWSLARSRKLAQRQYALLTGGLLALKPQGAMVYSTCSISPIENDGVIEKLLQKKAGFNVIQSELPDAILGELGQPEKTRYGFIYLPDVSGIGPIYFCLLQKNG